MTHAEFRESHRSASGLEPPLVWSPDGSAAPCIGELATGGAMIDPADGHQVEILVCRSPDCQHVVVWDRTDDCVRNDYHPDPRALVKALAARMRNADR
jgi:hypothetical protein